MNRNAVAIAVGAAVGAAIGVAIGDIAHLTGYWPHVVVALGAAAGVFIAIFLWGQKRPQ